MITSLLLHPTDDTDQMDYSATILGLVCECLFLCAAVGCACVMGAGEVVHDEGEFPLGAWSRGPDWSAVVHHTHGGRYLLDISSRAPTLGGERTLLYKRLGELGFATYFRVAGPAGWS